MVSRQSIRRTILLFLLVGSMLLTYISSSTIITTITKGTIVHQVTPHPLSGALRLTDSQLNSNWTVPTEVNDTRVVFYNRVAKCGSTTMIWTLRRISAKLNYNLNTFDHHNIQKVYGDNLEGVLAKYVMSKSSDTLTISQLPYVDFSRLEMDFPIYINVIRDPIDRMVSAYYFQRFGFKKRQGQVNMNRPRNNFTEAEKNQSFNECVLTKGMLCTKGLMPLFAHFCGFRPECKNRDKYALQQSKVNAVRYFSVIGLLEDMNTTLKVLEAVLPRYFAGFGDIYHSSPEIKGSKTLHKEPASPKVRSILRQSLRHEYDFYEFVKKRFYEQVLRLKKSNKIS